MSSIRKIFDEHHDMFRDTVQKFIKKHVVPYHEEWDKKGVVSRDFWLEAGAAGVPESCTGQSLSRLVIRS